MEKVTVAYFNVFNLSLYICGNWSCCNFVLSCSPKGCRVFCLHIHRPAEIRKKGPTTLEIMSYSLYRALALDKVVSIWMITLRADCPTCIFTTTFHYCPYFSTEKKMRQITQRISKKPKYILSTHPSTKILHLFFFIL